MGRLVSRGCYGTSTKEEARSGGEHLCLGQKRYVTAPGKSGERHGCVPSALVGWKSRMGCAARPRNVRVQECEAADAEVEEAATQLMQGDHAEGSYERETPPLEKEHAEYGWQ